MTVYPKSITPCPIIEAIIEIRYTSSLPTEAVFGSIYSKLELNHNFEQPIPQPILQIPEIYRNQDDNLKYQPYYILNKNDNLQIRIGPHSIVFSCINSYLGWTAFSSFFAPYIEKLFDSKIMSRIERIGLRYVNLFKMFILDKINLVLNLYSRQIVNESITLRIEKQSSQFVNIIQLSNNIRVQSVPYNGIGSLVDIDCIFNISDAINTSSAFIIEYINKMHDQEKQLFFDMLKNEFLETLNPVW